MNFGKVALLALASASMVFMASCKKDEPAKKAPTFVINNKDGKNINGDVKSKEVFPLQVIAKPSEGVTVKSVKYVVSYQGGNNPGELNIKKTTLGYVGEFKLDVIPAGVEKGTIKFTATDSEKATSDITINFDFTGAAPTPNPETGWNAEKQGGISHTNGIGKAAYDLKNGRSVTLDNKTAATDRYMMNTSLTGGGFTAAWTSNEVAGIAAPNNKGNGTEFAKIDGVDYATITPADAEAKFNAGAKTKDVTGVKEGDVYVAKLSAELYIIKITKVDTKNNSTRKESDKGCIEFSYKAKK